MTETLTYIATHIATLLVGYWLGWGRSKGEVPMPEIEIKRSRDIHVNDIFQDAMDGRINEK